VEVHDNVQPVFSRPLQCGLEVRIRPWYVRLDTLVQRHHPIPDRQTEVIQPRILDKLELILGAPRLPVLCQGRRRRHREAAAVRMYTD